MNCKILIYILVGLILIGNLSCIKESSKNINSKDTLLKAENYSALIDSIVYYKRTFIVFSDSTAKTITKRVDFDKEQINTYKHRCKIVKDSIYFNKAFDSITKAVIKNGFIEFINENSRIEIKNSTIGYNHLVNLTNYKYYAIFPSYCPNTIFNKSDFNAYDINQHELSQIDSLLLAAYQTDTFLFKKPIQKYYKQCIAAKNKKGEVIVWVNGGCYEPISNDYKYDIQIVHDGGNCFFAIWLNLTTKKYYRLHFHGEA